MIYFRYSPLVEQYDSVYVAREDLCLVEGHRENGFQPPCLSKMRGIYNHIQNRPNKTIGVVVTERTYNGWAVASCCRLLNRKCIVYYPVYTRPRPIPKGVKLAGACGAETIRVQAGRQAIMNAHAAKHLSFHEDAYMMPQALKLKETSDQAYEMAIIALDQLPNIRRVIVPTGTGTHLRGISKACEAWGVHCIGCLCYPVDSANMREYVGDYCTLVGPLAEYTMSATCDHSTAPFPHNPYYEGWAWEWMKEQGYADASTLFWNIGQ